MGGEIGAFFLFFGSAMKNQENTHAGPVEVLRRMTYTLSEAALVVGQSEKTVSRWLAVGKIEALPDSRHKLISRSKLDRYIETGVWAKGFNK